MRRQNGICLVCRHAVHSRSVTGSGKRYSSSRNREPYVLPRLVIDLDASDSKFVRKLEELADKAPEAEGLDESATLRQVRRANSHPHNQRKNTRQWEKRRNYYSLHTRTVTAPDLLSYALLGNPAAFPTSQNFQLRKLFKSQGIHPSDNAETKIQQLTHNFTTNQSNNLGNAGFMPEREPNILVQIRTCKIFEELRRMISMLSSTVEGCKFLAANGVHVVESIRTCRKSEANDNAKGIKSITTVAILELLNNLFLNMKSKGVELGPDLCNAGLYYSSKSYSLRSTRMYLEILRERSYPTNWRTAHAITSLTVNHCRGTAFHKSRNRFMDRKDRSKEILKLLTGWESGGVPQSGEEQKPCFASLVSQDHNKEPKSNLYPRYIIGLGQIGASEALWYEWANATNNLSPKSSPSRSRGEYITARAEIFPIAFLVARDSERALAILKSFERDVVHRDNAEYQPKDSQFTSLYGLGNTSCEILMEYYKSHRLMPTDRFREEVKKRLSDEPGNVLVALDGLLVLDWIETRKPKSISFSIDWANQDGVEGLAIMDPDLEIIYFKPLSRTAEHLSIDMAAL